VTDADRLLTAQEVAHLLGVTKRWVQARLRFDIERLGDGQDLTAESAAQELRRDHVHAPTLQKAGQLALDGDEVQAQHATRLKLYQHVAIAVGTKIVPERGAKDGQALDVVLAATQRPIGMRWIARYASTV
jgi:hypothetical protein